MENNLDQYKIAELIFHELRGELSEADSTILKAWKSENPENMALYNKIINENAIREKISRYDQTDTDQAWGRFEKQMRDRKKPIRGNFKTVLRYAVAASIVMLLGIFLLFKLTPERDEDKLVEQATTISTGSRKAILTTSNNEQIALGELKESKTYSLKNAVARDTNNTLTYRNIDQKHAEETFVLAMNKLKTPRGGEYSLVLSDGTRVFLNAETELTFPEVFASDVRKVILNGEAYFEVAESETKAFIVKTPDYDIQVYGTAFNVSAYASDRASHTTLVEGSVGINTTAGKEIKLVPGEQAYFDKSDNSLVSKRVDTYVYTAWKDGKFIFDDASLEEIMMKLERWYNTNTEYLDKEIKNRHFSGTLDRYENITEILDVIALTTRIEFSIEGDIIYVDKK